MRKLQKNTTPQKRPTLVYTFKIGWFSALNVKLDEVAINEVVLRVPLPPPCKLQKKQHKEHVSSRKPTVSSLMNRKPIKKSIHRYSVISDKKVSSSKQTPHKRSAEQPSVSSPVSSKSVLKPKRRRLSVNDSKDSSVPKSSSEQSLDSKTVKCELIKKPKRHSLAVNNSKETLRKQSPIKSPSKQSFDSKLANCETDRESKRRNLPVSDSKELSSKQQSPLRIPSKRVPLPVNGTNNSSSKQQSPSKNASEQLSQTTNHEGKNALEDQQETVDKAERFAGKLRQKLKQLVQIPSLGSSQTKLTVDFTKLSDLVTQMKLPSAQWRVTVLMNRDLSLVFEFTNKSASRYVRFAETIPHCNIVVSGKSVILLGCPKTVDSLKDIEILLEIVDELDLKDCMFITSS